ncbi:MAG: YhbY family RNA-binding protein [Candidatus Poseidoniales archaeon]|jgi:RNA-binding protein|tara:strand:- start:1423 stop:1689 length:267 start_codon:yes stop_codon:yes gene_type:complete
MDKEIPKSIHNLATSHDFQPSVRIGKSGITDLLIEEIKSQLSKKSVVKIKINRGLFDKKDIKNVWNSLAEETSSTLVLARGNVGVLWQ